MLLQNKRPQPAKLEAPMKYAPIVASSIMFRRFTQSVTQLHTNICICIERETLHTIYIYILYMNICIHFIFMFCHINVEACCYGGAALGERGGARERDLKIHDTSSKVGSSVQR